MEGNLSSGNMISGSGGTFDLQGNMLLHHQQLNSNISNSPFSMHQPHHHNPNAQSARQQGTMVHASIHESFPLRMGVMQDCTRHNQTVALSDLGKGDRGKNSVSDEDEPSYTEEGHDNQNNENRGKNMSTWHRVKWSDPMVRLLITAVSYIGEDASMEHGGGARRKYANLQKKGKWKSVSKVMAERGHFVSPQQCEDKFNDLNKRYKRLNEILGRGTSCEVVENPSLLDLMDHVSDKAKDEVRKILSSKHLYYEEMCSYHNGNRLHLPPDPELQRVFSVGDGSSKRLKQNEGPQAKNVQADMNQEGVKANHLQDQWMKHRLIQLDEQKIQIQAQMLELEKERLKWKRYCRKKDSELEMMRMENERMKLENDQMALELKRKEMSTDLS
ncbi:hypothetical protein CTI12_AA295560 [Artemisia annua]|uniref:Myb/SANT-like DNA-binding domain-containing protein n=1 Tax=Artemisia annua TaxID=35608 RepID=A0A2U1N841_ARTAN|nr:hypothetical protein CTI12_AA295560 [Artemisia annua]